MEYLINPFWSGFIILIVLLLFTSVALLIYGIKKHDKRLFLLSLVSFLITLSCILGLLITMLNWSHNSREYQEDIIVKLSDSNSAILIKEWTFLLESGAEIYFLQDEKKIFLGETGSGDDGICSFQNGNYEILQNKDQSITVRWQLNKKIWNEKTFLLPQS